MIHMRSWNSAFFVTLLTVLFFMLCTAQLIAFLPSRFWLSDVLSEFALQYLLCFAASIGIFVLLRKFRAALIALAGIIANFVVLLPLYLPPPPPCAQCPGESLHIVQFNLYYKNDRARDFVEWATADTTIDLLLLSEVHTNQQLLEPLKTAYPFSWLMHGQDLAVFSRIPLGEVRRVVLLPTLSENNGYLDISLNTPNTNMPVRIFSLHPIYSIRPELQQLRNAYLRIVAMEIIKAPEPYKIVAGDFNTNPWNSIFSEMMSRSGLYNAQQGRGVVNSWHVGHPRTILNGFMLDNMLVSENIYVEHRYTGDDFGSDHLPVIATLRLQKSP